MHNKQTEDLLAVHELFKASGIDELMRELVGVKARYSQVNSNELKQKLTKMKEDVMHMLDESGSSMLKDMPAETYNDWIQVFRVAKE